MIVVDVDPTTLVLYDLEPDAGVANMSYDVAPAMLVHDNETDDDVCSGLVTVGTATPAVDAVVYCVIGMFFLYF